MKKIFLLIIIFCFIMSLLNSEPTSFRNQALGNVIDDDLDLVYDPIDLKFVSGSRLYTNLSNLVSSNEEFLANNSSNTFLIGYSTKNPLVENLWTAFFIEFQKTKVANSIAIDSDLNGLNDLFGNGFLSDEFTGYYDITGDGIYDLLQQISQDRSNYDKVNQWELALNNTFDMEKFIVGFKAHYNSNSTNLNNDYNMNYIENNIEDNFDYLHISELDEYENSVDNSDLELMASIMLLDFRGSELRGDLEFRNIDHSNNILTNYYSEEDDYDIDITILEDYNITDNINNNCTERKGNEIALGTSIRRTIVKAEARKNEGYWKIGGEISVGSSDYTELDETIDSYTENYFDGLDTLFTDYREIDTETTSTEDSGSQTNTNLGFMAKLNYPFSEKVYFGIGVHYQYQSLSRKTDFTENFENSYEYEILDEETTFADYITTESYSIESDRTIEQYTSIFVVPVGLEYKFTTNQKWDIRFGSIFRSICHTINDAREIKTATPTTTETIYGDGTVEIEIEDNTYNSTSEQTQTTSSLTDYYYGLGFRPTQNLQIDLLGFLGSSSGETDLFSADFYKQLRLSFTILF
ncbi:MAG: hypothetical protein K9N07_03470 [Candidatus Cloacimonetes bacterium]|nr:hypothetical protein [Candidatus Cloacimonadota bacterium]